MGRSASFLLLYVLNVRARSVGVQIRDAPLMAMSLIKEAVHWSSSSLEP